MKINAYLAEKNISDNELLVREWVVKLILDEKEEEIQVLQIKHQSEVSQFE